MFNNLKRKSQKVLKLAMCFMDWREPTLFTGEGAVLKLPKYIKEKGINRVLVVTDKGLMSLKLLDPLFDELKKDYVSGLTLSGGDPLFPVNRNCVTGFAKEVKEKAQSKAKLYK